MQVVELDVLAFKCKARHGLAVSVKGGFLPLFPQQLNKDSCPARSEAFWSD